MRAALVLLAIAACDGAKPAARAQTTPAPAPPAAAGPPRPASVTDDLIASTDRVLAVLTKIANDVGAAADCKTAAAALRADAVDMQNVTVQADDVESAWSGADTEAQQWFTSVYAPRFQANNEKMMTKMSCKEDPDFAAAIDALNGKR